MTNSPGRTLAILELAGSWNPYYLAYAFDTNAKDPKAAFDRDGGNHLFFAWNNDKWKKTCEAHGLNKDYCSQFFDEHLETLAALPNVREAIKQAEVAE